MKIKFLICLYLTTFLILPEAHLQNKFINTYEAENTSYFINPQKVINGYVATDNHCNGLYLISGNSFEKLISAPGCGRYYSVSPDKKHIGFKLIQNGLQAPALINTLTKKITLLHQPVNQCGQPTFTNNGQIGFTIGNFFQLIEGNTKTTLNLSNYSNIAPISPCGNFIVFSAPDETLILFKIHQKSFKTISEKGKLSLYPQWSPDGKKIMYQSDMIFIYNIETDESLILGKGFSPKWSPDSKTIVFHLTETKDNNIYESEIYITDIETKKRAQITETNDIFEMHPSYIDNETIVCSNFANNEISILQLSKNNDISKKEVICFNERPILDYYNLPIQKSEVRIPGTIPYLHQVYDTPNDHYGHGSCAPSTSIMAFAYFNRLPKWPISCNSPYTHTSNYGAYVSQKYTLNEYFYENVSQTSGGDNAYGGYGYMWGLGSPNSKMKDYTVAHYFNAIQYWTSSCTMAKTRAEIDAGYPHSMCVMLTSSGHLILCKGYVVGQYTLIFSDPYGNKNTPGYPSYDGHEAYYDWPGHNNGYQNLDYNGSYGYIAWTITNQGNEAAYNDTIIDDIFYNHGFHINNSQNGSHMRYFHDANTGYNNHMWYTYTMATLSDICWVTWQPHLSVSGTYEIYAYIPSQNANASGARYKVTHAGGDTIVVINQSNYNDEWVSLGTYNFDTSMVAMVYLGDSTGVSNQKIAFDALWWQYKPVPQASFAASLSSCCKGDTVNFTNTSLFADSLEWHFQGGQPTYSTELNPSILYDSTGNFYVMLIAHGIGGTDTITYPSCIEVKSPPEAFFNITDSIVSLPNALVGFINLSVNANTYFWDFGNGNTSNDINPYCIYDAEGFYTVSLYSEGECGLDSIIKTNLIQVIHESSVNESNNIFFSVYPNPFSNEIIIENSDITRIRLFNPIGQKLSEIKCKNSITIIPTESFPKGFYFMLIEMKTDKQYLIKLVKE